MEVKGKPRECAPDVSGTVCSRDHIVKQMKEFVERETGKPCNGNNQQILAQITKLLGCDSESCVLSDKKFQSHVGSETAEREKDERMLPAGPRNTTALLNNVNIDETLQKYTNKHPNFHHIPFRMIDFALTEPREFIERHKRGINIEEVKSKMLTFLNPEYLVQSGKNCVGVVLNTDVHTGGGKHWFALFLDFRNPHKITLEYFNSSGNIPMHEVHEFMVNFQRKVIKLFPQADCSIEVVSHKQIQDSKTECGVYSLYFIISRVEGISLDEFQQLIKSRGIPDEKMMEYRKHLFRQHD